MKEIDYINKILFEIWDPLGVSCNEFLRNEYIDVAFRIHRLLKKNDSLEEVQMILIQFESELGATADDLQRKIAASQLLLLKK